MQLANKIVMIIAGVVLVIAAVLKSHHLLVEPVVSPTFWESWLFFVIQIPLELGLGIWLICGLFRKAAWLAALLAYACFIIVTLYKAMEGSGSCGCFGLVHVNPWITLFAIDVPIFLAMAIAYPRGLKLIPAQWPSAKRFFGIAIPSIIIIAAITGILILGRPARKSKNYQVIDAPEAGSSRWDVLENIDIAGILSSQIAVLLFYHYDCPDCRQAIKEYELICSELAGDDNLKIAFIEVPPYAPYSEDIIFNFEGDNCITGRLQKDRKWYVATPLVVVLVDGVVIKSWPSKTPGYEEILEAVFAE